MYIKHIYNLDELYLTKSIYKIIGYGNNTVEVELNNSKFHIVINPYNTGFDKYLIQEVVKEYTKNKLINIDNQQSFKIIVINNVDKLSYYAQTSLRCTMEKYSNYCKFFITGKNISKIIEPIKSRCLFIRIPKPNNFDILEFILNIYHKEKRFLPKDTLLNLVNKNNFNVKEILWNIDLNLNNVKYNNKIEDTINEIILLINNKNYIKNINLIRDKLYLLFITNIDFKVILKLLLINLSLRISDSFILKEISNYISDTDLNISLGKRVVIHFENLLYKIMYVLNNNNIII